MTVIYEWDVETVASVANSDHDEDECIDHYHCVKFTEALARSATDAPDGYRHQIVLVRDDDEGRSWAYLDGFGALPGQFSNANGDDVARVPLRFSKEVTKATGSAA